MALSCATKSGRYQEIFAAQVEALANSGLIDLAYVSPQALLDLIRPLGRLLEDIESGKDSLPFVIVLPGGLVSLKSQVSCLTREGRRGMTHLRVKDLHPVYNRGPARWPYLMTSVRDGRDYCGHSATDFSLAMRLAGRTALSWEEGLALVRHVPDLLNGYRPCFADTRHGHRRMGVPCLRLGDDHVWLEAGHQDAMSEDYGFPSCLSRRWIKYDPPDGVD